MATPRSSAKRTGKPPRPIEIGASDDAALGGAQDTLTPALKKYAPHAKWIRIFAQSNKPMPDTEVNRALAKGYRVQLVSWAGPGKDSPQYPSRPATPGEVGRWSGQVAEHFRGRVSRYSVQNEPEIFGGGDKNFARRGELYARQYAHGYRAIKRANSGAKVLIGENSGRGDWTVPFLDALLKHPLTADGYAFHGYNFDGSLGMKSVPNLNLRLAAGRVRTRKGAAPPIYITENGYKPGTPGVSGQIKQDFRIAKKNGVRQMTWYQVQPPTAGMNQGWNTSLMGDPVAVKAFYKHSQ